MGFFDWILMLLYLGVILFIAVVGLKKVKTSSEFATSGANLPVGIVTATLAAAYIGGSFAVGAGGAAFREGYTYFFALSGFCLATIAVGLWVAPKMRHYQAETVGDLMEHHYGVAARVMTGIISIVVCAAILGAQVRALGTIAETFLGTDFTISAIVLTLFVIAYSTTGGLWTDVRADVIHFTVLSVIIPIAVLLAVKAAGGGAEIQANLPDHFFSISGDNSIWFFITLFIGFVFGETLVQPYAQRAFAGDSAKVVKTSFVLAGLFGIAFLFTTTSAGIVARSMFPDITSDAAVPEVIARLMPAGIAGLSIAAFFAVIMSSASSFLNSTTVVFVRDIWTLGGRRQIQDRARLRSQRIINLIVGFLALSVALALPNIIDILIVYYSAWAPTVIAPLLIGVLCGIRHKTAGIIAMCAGLIAVGIWTGLLDDPFGILGLAVGLVVNLIVFCIVVSLTKTRDMTPSGFDITAQGGK